MEVEVGLPRAVGNVLKVLSPLRVQEAQTQLR